MSSNTAMDYLRAEAKVLSSAQTVPIHLRQILDEYKLPIELCDKKIRRANLFKDEKGRYKIKVASKLMENRSLRGYARYFVAHELGHYLLIKHGDADASNEKELWRIEHACNAFSRWLLIPDRFLVPVMAGKTNTSEALLRISNVLTRKAIVSWETSAQRIVDYEANAVFFAFRFDSIKRRYLIKFSSDERGIARNKQIEEGTFLFNTLKERISKPSKLDGSGLEVLFPVDIETGEYCIDKYYNRIAVRLNYEGISGAKE